MHPLILLISVGLLCSNISQAQSPLTAPLPAPLSELPVALEVHHFPDPVPANPGTAKDAFNWYWKHTTSLLSQEPVQIEEGGAYLFYNQQWNLRVRYDRREMSKLFHCPKGDMQPGQPYTFPDNWRTDNEARGGWALWYVIARKPNGERICGYAPLETLPN